MRNARGKLNYETRNQRSTTQGSRGESTNSPAESTPTGWVAWAGSQVKAVGGAVLSGFKTVTSSEPDIEEKVKKFENDLAKIIEKYRGQEAPISRSESFHHEIAIFLRSIEDFHGEQGLLHKESLAKNLKLISSKLYAFLEPRSPTDFIFLSELALRLATFRGSLLSRPNNPEKIDAVEVIENFMSLASKAVGEKMQENLETENLATFMIHEVRRSCKEQLRRSTLLLEKLSSKLSNFTGLWELASFCDFMVDMMLMRLAIQSEFYGEEFAHTADEVLSQFFNGIAPRFLVPLTIEKGEYIANSMKSIRLEVARSRRHTTLDYVLVSPFIQLRGEIVNKVMGQQNATKEKVIRLIEVERRLLLAFNQLVSIDGNYLGAVTKELIRASNPETVESINDSFLKLFEAIQVNDLCNKLLREYLGFVVGQLKFTGGHFASAGSRGLEIFTKFSETAIPQIRALFVWTLLKYVFEDRTMDLTSLTATDILNLNLQDCEAIQIFYRLNFLVSFIEKKSFAVAAKLLQLHDKTAIPRLASQLFDLVHIVNKFAAGYKHIAGESGPDKAFGFFSPALKGIVTVLDKEVAPLMRNQYYELPAVRELLAQFLALVLHAVELHRIAQYDGTDTALPNGACALIKKMQFIARRFMAHNAFFERLRSLEIDFLQRSQTVTPPKLYTLVCKEVALAILQVVTSNIHSGIERVETLCKFALKETALGNTTGIHRDSTIAFSPTVLGLALVNEVLNSIVKYLQGTIANIFALPTVVGEFVDLMDRLEEYRPPTHHASFLREMRNDIKGKFELIKNEITSASSLVMPILQFATQWHDPLEDISDLLTVDRGEGDRGSLRGLKTSAVKIFELTILENHLLSTQQLWKKFIGGSILDSAVAASSNPATVSIRIIRKGALISANLLNICRLS